MSEPTSPTDADLVAGVLAADRDAFAAVYDRYGTKLYDFAYSMLRHREDAADAVADSFVLVAERLSQLRDPERLRPWLYAIVRSECLRKLRARKRVAFGGEEQLIQMADDALTPDQEAERAAMQKIVWDASAGLADRDRALLDLHLRQGLEGAELGEAMGVSASNAYVMLNRLRAQVDRSLGALLIARLGRDDCDDLDDLLADWDGTFSPLIRKRVSRHVDDCDVCSKRRKKILSPWMLLASVPIFAAPLTLRDRVVSDPQLVAYTTPTGEPLTVTPALAPRGRPKAAVTAVAAAVVIILAGIAALFWAGNDDDPSPKGDVVTSQPTVQPSTEPTLDAKPTTTPTPSPTATTPAPGNLTVSTTSIALGRSGSTSTITLTNTGGLPVDYRLSSGAAWLSASPSTGRVAAGTSSRVTVRADRGDVGEGRSSGRLSVSWAAGSAAVNVSVVEERDPVVGRPSLGSSSTCTSNPVRVSVSDESGLSSVVLRWSGAGSGSTSMSRSGSVWTADMGQFAAGGSVTLRVTATDRRGNTASSSRTVNVDPCPG
ncbi:sigma-70 family RNA polymerase sigma factor [Aeromicrobium ginsengisoli]|uniref:Sigma-70 family RNA polymerase sigma factor n=1 Tax=Aeromicrobium ginsengisoli TaxID=363867 RepID=A0A5M4FHM3_9ACTN|nr:sigma-70 family RNA polymerase sigma factor [Aeromicrobium ginsengisoli]KAA1399223.1 sigma-70 family RNA polymerase sigma factor [Aeromicrobium ginsengisoli]